jgi:hypothetical protein
MFENEIKKIKRNSQVCLWGSVGMVFLVALFIYIGRWHFLQTREVANAMMIAGSVLSVLTVSMALLTIRKRVPLLRQTDDLGDKLRGYAAHIASFYRALFVVVVVLGVLTVLSGRNMLLALTMLVTLMLFMAFPNIYRMKVEMGLTDDEMRSLFGDEFIPDVEDVEEVQNTEDEKSDDEK